MTDALKKSEDLTVKLKSYGIKNDIMHIFIIGFLSAFLFGASTPFGKLLLDVIPPFELAGLFYCGAALGVFPIFIKENQSIFIARIDRKNGSRLIGAILLGGFIGPVFLLKGLKLASSASVAMWLNLELAATALLGFLFFKDHFGKYGVIGVMGTICASTLLSWNEGEIGFTAMLYVLGASICWGFDNHLTALIDGITPSQSTFWKGIVAGITNLVISSFDEAFSMNYIHILAALSVGIFSYGISITLYINSAQSLGATRSQMIFSSAPFFGLILSFFVLGESISVIQMISAAILIISLTVLFFDQHNHLHFHQVFSHKHWHHHTDDHHHHHHHSDETKKYHIHWHHHRAESHSHPHWPDIHHRHNH